MYFDEPSSFEQKWDYKFDPLWDLSTYSSFLASSKQFSVLILVAVKTYKMLQQTGNAMAPELWIYKLFFVKNEIEKVWMKKMRWKNGKFQYAWLSLLHIVYHYILHSIQTTFMQFCQCVVKLWHKTKWLNYGIKLNGKDKISFLQISFIF